MMFSTKLIAVVGGVLASIGVLLVGLGVFVWSRGAGPPPNLNTNFSQYISHTPIPKYRVVDQGIVPAELSVPAIALKLPVVGVGKTRSGSMQLPPSPMVLAWYDGGYKPGRAGNAVITGHLDTANWQDPTAAFWRLGDLRPGMIVLVTDAQGVSQEYQVVGLHVYTSGKLPMAQLFGPALVPQIDLVTCHGVWRGWTLGYSQRLVVTAQMVRNFGLPGAGIRLMPKR